MDIVPATWLGLQHTAKLGSDGNLGELRPDPSNTPEGLCNNMYELIRQVPAVLQNNIAAAYSSFNGLNAGFHIHIEMPQEVLFKHRKQYWPFIRLFAQLLDYFVSIPAVIGETDNYRRYKGTPYGMPGDFRLKLKTFEYRTPGAYILRSKELSEGILSLAWLSANDILNHAAIISDGWKPGKALEVIKALRNHYKVLSIEKLIETLTSESKEMAAAELPEIIKKIEGMVKYESVRNSIIDLLTIIGEAKNMPGPLFVTNWTNSYEEVKQN